METPKRKKLITYIDADMWDEAAEQAVREDRSTASVVRRALRKYLTQQKHLRETRAANDSVH